MNREFPTDLRLEGIALGKSEYGEDLYPYIITSQRYIEAVDDKSQHPTEEAVEHFMRGLGFDLIPDSSYNWIRESDGVVVTDTRVYNFIISDAGITPIDVIIGRKVQ